MEQYGCGCSDGQGVKRRHARPPGLHIDGGRDSAAPAPFGVNLPSRVRSGRIALERKRRAAAARSSAARHVTWMGLCIATEGQGGRTANRSARIGQLPNRRPVAEMAADCHAGIHPAPSCPVDLTGQALCAAGNAVCAGRGGLDTDPPSSQCRKPAENGAGARLRCVGACVQCAPNAAKNMRARAPTDDVVEPLARSGRGRPFLLATCVPEVQP